MPNLAHLLPLPGPVWGPYPLRGSEDQAPAWRGLHGRTARSRCRSGAQAAMARAQAFAAMPAPQRQAVLSSLRGTLRRTGLQPDTMATALGVTAACAVDAVGLRPRQTQLMAAWVLLDNRMGEMATGEGKTLAIALAAAAAGLAGMPVHVVTANDYLAGRDARQMAPLFAALGLRVASVAGVQGDTARRAVYHHDIVYATAKDLAFDFLRDRQSLGARHPHEQLAQSLGTGSAPAPLLRGLCMALLDEADSILLDEAELPLILSRAAPHAARRAFLWQALALARRLVQGRDYRLLPVERVAHLTPAGEEQLAQWAAPLAGPWLRARYRREAVVLALAALHLFRRNTHYLVRDGSIELIDEVTGRVAPGRVWSRGLHTLVALKEGLSPPAETETVAQTTYQRFFQRYWRLCGISGTLREARAELRQVYGSQVVRIPLHQPDRRRQLPLRSFADLDALFDAVVIRVATLQAAGRPVLVGTDNVAASLQLSGKLQQAGIAHQVLNALNDAAEAAIVAQAGHQGRVTVATRMAGRGTDIALDAPALAAGGLHVISCQHNPSRRLDRQLAGRAARHGDPGSCEHWICAQPEATGTDNDAAPGPPDAMVSGAGLQDRIAHGRQLWMQWQEEQRRRRVRHHLLEQDLQWERRLAFAGRIV
jgi:preprotein translocase subunit SecA